MKICMITNAFSLEKNTPPKKIGGAESCAERISKCLSQKNHTVVVITQKPFAGLHSLFPKAEVQDGLKIYSFYPLNIFSIYNTHKKSLILKGLWRLIDIINPLPAFLIARILKKEGPDIIHNHILHGFSPFFLLGMIKKANIPMVQTLHSYGFLCLRCDLLRRTGKICSDTPFLCRIFVKISAKLIGGLPDAVISPSRFCLGIYERNHFFTHARKFVLPNGIETYDRNPHVKNGDLKGRLNILYAGRLVTAKGVHILIEAFRKLEPADICLYIVGEGFLESYLKKLAARDPRINFTGKISWRELQGYYKVCDLTVVPSIYYEILGNVVLESMTSGTPVIGSRIGGIAELIEDGFNGYLFEPGNTAELNTLLLRLINDPQQLKAMGENAFEFAKKYDITNHVSESEKIYFATKNSHSRN